MSEAHDRILERGVMLADSVLWRMQDDYFVESGARVWSANAVPSYVTSNPVIARAYARVFAAWLRDFIETADATFDPGQPVYLVELGAGSGRLAFHFLQSLYALLGDSALAALDVRYVITDLADHTLDRLRRHPQLAPLVAAGRLDFARFDVERDEVIVLDSGRTLAPGTIANPLGVITNYLLCSLRSDVFRCEDGALARSLVTLVARDAPPDAAQLLPHVDLELEHAPVEDAAVYPEPAYNALLDHYRRTMIGTELVFPIAALRCLDRLRAIAGDRMLLLVGDKGDLREEDLDGLGPPVLARHGSVSLPVNFHALGAHARAVGGRFLSTPHRHASLAICGFLFGPAGQPFRATAGAYREHVVDGGPDDFFALKKALDPQLPALELRALLAYLRLSSWDSTIFHAMAATLLERLVEASPEERGEVRRAARAVWDRYFFLGELRDLPYALGLVALRAGAVDEAIEYLEASLHLYGRGRSALRLLAECHLSLGDEAAAERLAREAAGGRADETT